VVTLERQLISSLGYVGITARDADAWRSFSRDVLGFEVVADAEGEAVLLRMDDRHHRLAVHPGQEDGLAYIGWETTDARRFELLRSALDSAGIATKTASEGELQQRRVWQMFRFADPTGITHEVFVGQEQATKSFQPGRRHSGFVTGGPLGMGHVVLYQENLEEAGAFYTEHLGMRLRDRIRGRVKMDFYGLNPRHHSLAMMERPGPPGLNHIMLQVADLDDVGVAFDLCVEHGVPVVRALGRHSNDQMFSFYLQTPSGFDFEYGADSIEVDDETWEVVTYRKGSVWGHQHLAST
jgi:extradiol dioxygenase